MTLILGIDPGSRITGFGVIKVTGKAIAYIASGCIKLPAVSLDKKLKILHTGLQAVMDEHTPDQAAIEQVFMSQNPASALKLGQARGAAMIMIAARDIPVAEYSARQIKQAVVGYGAADKLQVQQMVRFLLKLESNPPADAADALAVAICHAHTQPILLKLSERSVK